MNSLSDIDNHFVKCLSYLHTSDSLTKGDNVPLQAILEEAIKNKYGTVKDYTSAIQVFLKPKPLERIQEFHSIINPFDDTKASNSDNELELDLLKEDLMCIVCNGMDVGVRNRLLECSECHALYHQECHNPIVTNDVESLGNWICTQCKTNSSNGTSKSSSSSAVIISTDSNSSGSSNGNSVSTLPAISIAVPSITTASTSTKSVSKSSHKHSDSSSDNRSSTSSSSSYKLATSSKSSDKYKSSSKSSSSMSSSSGLSSKSSSSSRSTMSPNINIISADKRIQIMKKKAASKLQEKRRPMR